jgi:hypothetical protein
VMWQALGAVHVHIRVDVTRVGTKKCNGQLLDGRGGFHVVGSPGVVCASADVAGVGTK